MPQISEKEALALEEMFQEACDQPIMGGLISPPDPGCVHDWQSHELDVSRNFHAVGSVVFVKRCSKCKVLGAP